MLFRSRGDTREADLISAGRRDLLRGGAAGGDGGVGGVGAGYLLARREIRVDESVLRTQNLAVFL